MSKADREFLRKEPCPACGSRDNLARYTDGYATCYSQDCDHWEPPSKGDEEEDFTPQPRNQKKGAKAGVLRDGDFREIVSRKISEETCRFFGYSFGEVNGRRCHIASYRGDDGVISGQKLRFPDKSFSVRGKLNGFFGKHLWRDRGRYLVVTEGELDALSVAEAFGRTWPVVSIPNGADSAKKTVKENLQWVEGFDKVIFCFDMDDPGQKAANECVRLLTPGKGHIVSLPKKDASEMLQAGMVKELTGAIYNAKAYRPEGVKSAAEVIADGEEEIQEGVSWPFVTVTKETFGQRDHEMYCYGAGTGCGKTDLLKQVAAHNIMTHHRKAGMLLFEEPNRMLTIDTVCGKIDKQIYHIPGIEFDKAQRDKTRKRIGDKLFMYRGADVDLENLLSVIRYMVVSQGCKDIFLDHITYLLDGMTDDDQVSAMKKLMKSLNDLNKELPFTLHYIAHLRKKEGKKNHEEGARITLDDFAGGKACTQYANFIFALERNQQSGSEDEKNSTIFRILKDRFTGLGTGKTIELIYQPETGCKVEADQINPFTKEEMDGEEAA